MQPQYLTIKDLFQTEDQYSIPIYQRNYAWEEDQISQLIQDIYDVYKENKNYYLGNLIVYKRGNVYETIDGQQRLTTLNILASVLKNNVLADNFFKNINLILKYDSRKISNETINYFNDFGNKATSITLHPQMEQAYEIISRKLKELFGNNFSNNKDFSIFLKYFLDKVKLLRIEVPPKTDLNHYFEVMNNRGEQLEKHEVLKALFLDVLSKAGEQSDKYRNTFNLIWNACSYMDRYVQYVYKKEYRVGLFGKDWKDFLPQTFNEICEITYNIEEINKQSLDSTQNKLTDIIKSKNIKVFTEVNFNEEGLERFTPVTSFPHFLLQVLRITVNSEVQLDDKKLIDEFKEYIFKKNNVEELVQKFGYNLLKLKYAFDRYIVKRDFKNEKEGWAILFLQKQNDRDIGYYTNTFGDTIEQSKLVHLQSMFHVSFPQTNYKHWLSACLQYLFTTEKIDEINVNHYVNYLECLSDAFYFCRVNDVLDYRKIIFEDNGYTIAPNPNPNQIKTYLNIGTDVNNFIFNRLDYLLINDFEIQKNKIPQNNIDEEFMKFNTHDFEFSFRSSVEHFAPQHPKNNEKPINNVDNFGNLCLIRAGENSKLNNHSPISKKDYYKKSKTAESLKQRLMMCYNIWNETTVDEHQNHMIELLNSRTQPQP